MVLFSSVIVKLFRVISDFFFFFFSSRRRHTRSKRDWSSDVCSSDLGHRPARRRRLAKDAGIRPASAMGAGGVLGGGRRRPAGDRGDAAAGECGGAEIGRASCRERVEMGGGDVALGEKEARQGRGRTE